MQLDDKTILDLAGQLGISADKKTTVAKAKSYEQKSDAELVSEIMKIKNQLEAANIPYEKQMAAAQAILRKPGPHLVKA